MVSYFTIKFIEMENNYNFNKINMKMPAENMKGIILNL